MRMIGESDEFKKVEQQFYKLLVGREPTLRQGERQSLLRKVIACLKRAPNYKIDDETLFKEWTSIFGSSWVEVAHIKERCAEKPSLELSKLMANLTLFGVGRLVTSFVREGFFRKGERDGGVIYSIHPLWKPFG